jgi:predicted patatin/cPLA2 family phospholipase
MLLLLFALAQGCVSVPKRVPVPDDLITSASIPAIPRARVWGDEAPPYADAWFALTKAELKAEQPANFGRPHRYLAISGGGAKGAFGAGLLVGWTEAGTRPEFNMVTGISTGALTAPWAFLGPDYDDVLEEMFTEYSTKELVEKRNIINAITSDAMTSTKKLAELLASFIDEGILEAIAAEHRKGRRLLIGTTNIDAQRPVIWNIGFIATSGEPFALDLIRSVILASASLPAAFPPVAVEVEADGQRFDELHVDGGAASQVFLYPALLDWKRVIQKLEVPEPPEIYVIRNARLDPEAGSIDRKLMPIAGRAISSLIRTQGIGDLYRIYALAERDGLNFNLAYIPAAFNEKPAEQFDPVWMRKLFDLGHEMAKDGYPWLEAPPDYLNLANDD